MKREGGKVIKYGVYDERPGHKMPRKFLDDATYTAAMEAFVIYCTDVVAINRERRTFYLVKRAVKPMKGWWWFGGRIFAGEHEVDAIRRIMKREISLDLSPERFTAVRLHRYFWKDREQEPQNVGCDILDFHFTMELSPEELKNVAASLEKKEYEQGAGLVEFSRPQMILANVAEPIIDLYDEVFSK